MNPIPQLIPIIQEAVYPDATVYYDSSPKNSQPPLVTALINDEHLYTDLGEIENSGAYDITVIVYGINFKQTTDLSNKIRSELNGYSTYPFEDIIPIGWTDVPTEHGRLSRGFRYTVIYHEDMVFDDSFSDAFA